MDEQKPGQVITPGVPVEPTLSSTDVVPAAQPSISPAPAPVEPEQNLSQEDAAKYQTPTQFVNEESETASQDEGVISWSASEYIAHHKTSKWYMLFGLTLIIGLVGIYFITSGDILSVVVVAVVAAVFVMYAGRQPNEQQYSISDQGITVGHKTYGFHEFKSFSVIDEGAFASIDFMPLKRFMPIISIYYAPDDEDKIVDALSQFLPFDHREVDVVDKLMKKIRF